MNLTFAGKTVIVTGAAHGFGRAISRAFAERGAHVWACDVLEDELRETEQLCRAVRRRVPRADDRRARSRRGGRVRRGGVRGARAAWTSW